MQQRSGAMWRHRSGFVCHQPFALHSASNVATSLARDSYAACGRSLHLIVRSQIEPMVPESRRLPHHLLLRRLQIMSPHTRASPSGRLCQPTARVPLQLNTVVNKLFCSLCGGFGFS